MPVPALEYAGIYEVSDCGRIRNSGTGTVRRLGTRKTGYLFVTLSRRSHKRSFLVHRLVLLAFAGEPPAGTEACHRDGDPANNVLSNIYWGTRSENMLDQVRHGTHLQARKTECKHGHPFSEENTYVYPVSGRRACLICKKRWARESRERHASQ